MLHLKNNSFHIAKNEILLILKFFLSVNSPFQPLHRNGKFLVNPFQGFFKSKQPILYFEKNNPLHGNGLTFFSLTENLKRKTNNSY